MKLEAILHIPLSQYAYAVDERTLTIRIRTAKNDLTSCMLYYGDRVAQEEPIPVTAVSMEKCASDDLFDYFEATFLTPYTRVCYYFLLSDGEEELVCYSRGLLPAGANSVRRIHRTEYFQFPYVRREDIPKVPDWAADIVMYHVFPDSFASARGEIPGSGRRIESADGAVAVSAKGGTLTGVRENIPYLKKLGVNCLYLNPIFRANSYHKYDTIDYFDIDPCFGTKEEFVELVRQLHACGIRVILDGVFNHCGPDFFAFRDVMEKGKDSNYLSWFYDMPLPVRYQDPPNYEAFAYVKEMPKLNTGNPEVAEYICRVGRYWIREANIDGWRLDVANEINHDLWRMFRKAVREEKRDCFLIAEIWEDAGCWLLGDQFDSAMNYTFSYLCRDFFADRKLSVSKFDAQMHRAMMRYPWPVALAQMNFLDSHDIPRFLSYCGGDVRRMELAFFYLFTGVGVPSVFYGDEKKIQGWTEEAYRAPMPWSGEDRADMPQNDTSENTTRKFAAWIRLRKDRISLRRGKYKTLLTDDERGVYAFLRYYQEERTLVVMNNSNLPVTYPVDEENYTIDALTGAAFDVSRQNSGCYPLL